MTAPQTIQDKIDAALQRLTGGRPEHTDGQLTVSNFPVTVAVKDLVFDHPDVASLILVQVLP